MPVSKRARRVWQRRSLAAFCFAFLLAITPYAHPSLPGSLWVYALASPASGVHDVGLAQAEDSAPRLRADQPNLGVLPRAAYVEATPATPPEKTSLLSPQVQSALLVPARSAGAPAGDFAPAFHRSSVGTARTPTGPPA